MKQWQQVELTHFGQTEEIRIATLRRDNTLRSWVIIWVVQVDQDLYVRCMNGREGAWFRGVLTQHAGRIKAGGVEKEVRFVEEEDAEINGQIDEAYLAKYGRYPQYVAPMITPKVKAATLKLVPRTANS